ncbi:hypothetical protein LTR97_012576 [Elasticomyces elasticus]|uniref:Uncharacterized protein n=1 Tax=Elasticomyces elasticus TaxID=574655 RepID=A0AAN7VQK2_9PEZI|nr:hypothetical protein LTR97_012576 [Elasticomyces elasticus]
MLWSASCLARVDSGLTTIYVPTDSATSEPTNTAAIMFFLELDWQWVVDATVNLLYWPVTPAADLEARLCGPSGSPMTLEPMTPGKPSTYVTLNATLTSPTVYVQATPSWGTSFSMDYANLNGPVPASACTCQPKCFTSSATFITTTDSYNLLTTITSYILQDNGQCSTIWDDYAPAIKLPPWGSQGATSAYTPLVYYDPPYALTSTSSAAGVTTPVNTRAEATYQPPTTTAQPASSAKQPMAVATTDSAAEAADSTTPASSAGWSDSIMAVPQPETQGEISPPSWQPTSVTAEPVNSNDRDSGAAQDSSTQVFIPSTVHSQSTAESVVVSTFSSRGIGDIIAGILGMSRSLSLSDSSVASDSFGEMPLPTLTTSELAIEAATYAANPNGEPSTVSEDFGTSDQGTAGISPSLFGTTGVKLTGDLLHSSTSNLGLTGPPSSREGR